MKRIVSVSLGSSCRDHAVETKIMGEQFKIERIGTNGDIDKAINLIRLLDGKVDAFGMGGIDLYIRAGHKRYILKDAMRLQEAAKITPMVDGGGLKNTLERYVVRYLLEKGLCSFSGKDVLLVCGMDRFGMAEALVEEGANVTFGDLIFGLNIPVPVKSLEMLATVGKILGPVVSNIPFKYLYPIGDKQEVIINKYDKYYNKNEIIAGDYLYIKKYLPEDITGKVILTNTVTAEDVKLLADRGAKYLITTTPEFQGRSFGTNVMEAVLVTLLNKPLESITEEDYKYILASVKFIPRFIKLDKEKLA
ncbi:MAG: quinate 5-dehydrogenase [Clostridia bacterium]|nr:quinate 5-dehydrogenase [Clostridia bacterium]MDD4048887.1 quinate 5-dehydrogenase [Clostridia bacterium]